MPYRDKHVPPSSESMHSSYENIGNHWWNPIPGVQNHSRTNRIIVDSDDDPVTHLFDNDDNVMNYSCSPQIDDEGGDYDVRDSESESVEEGYNSDKFLSEVQYICFYF